MVDALYFVHMPKIRLTLIYGVCFLMGGLCNVVEIAEGGSVINKATPSSYFYRTIFGMCWWDHRQSPLIFPQLITNNAIRGFTNKTIIGYRHILCCIAQITHKVKPVMTHHLLISER